MLCYQKKLSIRICKLQLVMNEWYIAPKKKSHVRQKQSPTLKALGFVQNRTKENATPHSKRMIKRYKYRGKKPHTHLPPTPLIRYISDRTCRSHSHHVSPAASPLLPFANSEHYTLHGHPSPLSPCWYASRRHGYSAARNRNDRNWILVCIRCWMRYRMMSSCCHWSRCSRLGRHIGCWCNECRWYNLKDRRKESCSCLWY